MSEYHIFYADSKDFQRADHAFVECFPWGRDEVRPFTIARVLWQKDGLAVNMQTDERPRHIQVRGLNGFVYVENCMEFFLMPDPENSREYINWEFNPIGSLYISIGESRENRRMIEPEDYRALFDVKPSIYAWGWEISYRIPFSFLLEHFPGLQIRDGHEMRGNFYKLCEKVSPPHYACWAPITCDEPDFHRPEFFGAVILRKDH